MAMTDGWVPDGNGGYQWVDGQGNEGSFTNWNEDGSQTQYNADGTKNLIFGEHYTTNPAEIRPKLSFWKKAGNFFKEWGHEILDVIGLIPFIGEAADLANAAWYFAEGDIVNGGLSLGAAVPFVGAAAIAGKYTVKAIKRIKTVHAARAVKAADEAAAVTQKVADDVGSAGAKQGDEVVESPKNGSTPSNRLGQQKHKEYKADEVMEGVREKEFILPSGKRIDFIDFEKKIIYELKPNNARAIKRGYEQLEEYKREIESIYGEGFKVILETYSN